MLTFTENTGQLNSGPEPKHLLLYLFFLWLIDFSIKSSSRDGKVGENTLSVLIKSSMKHDTVLIILITFRDYENNLITQNEILH